MADEAREMTFLAFKDAGVAKYRLWAANDEVTRLRRQLIDAEQRAETAAREYDEQKQLLGDAWGLLRSELTLPSAAASDPTGTPQ